MLASVRNEYRSDVVKYTVSAVCAVLEKFDMGCVPREVLYKLLLCVAKCLVLLVHPGILGCLSSPKKTTGSGRSKRKAIKLQLVTNQLFYMFANILHKTESRVYTPGRRITEQAA
mmetsp:Transcript_21248/g.24460  ORF Transcript_21248/g.24460 Transcript_21248/m.24460 type:complete len:115 (+) Transcript_21248:417-761(+)